MSLKVQRITGGDDTPCVTIKVTGWHDIYRFAHHMTKGQCEFADAGFMVLRRMRRRVGKQRWAWIQAYMHGASPPSAWRYSPSAAPSAAATPRRTPDA